MSKALSSSQAKQPPYRIMLFKIAYPFFFLVALVAATAAPEAEAKTPDVDVVDHAYGYKGNQP
ncbi:hypothetical protein SISSUDRAFT_1062522 [Sistotremastrum suecicum HHB10207 ss-3]|uniref:Uncharacterized protein n=1 Tax=Sistotremastrum suecicum HHB10207 ss-3 TaxID=1314776 RepID=A0A166CSK0_9AGAM|nr:hypothetical protein SISSUDRAFT_1062522 [Sistotremastrum suecicum HHB10207 ss-3]